MNFRPVFALLFIAGPLALAAEVKPQRVPWTTSRIHGSPEPAKPFIAAPVFPKLMFREATEIVFDAVSDRWLVLERTGKIFSFLRQGDVAEAQLVADFKAIHPDCDNLYGFAFHPKFAENRQVFVTYITGSGKPDGTKLARFMMKAGPAPQFDTASEQIILTWRSGGHNGANLQFGPDGFLYISTGDSEVPSPPDPLNTGQDITDLLSSILRIDVDRQDTGLAYAIPKDNPFVHTPGARAEIWAYGLRNPWKMSFDRATGRLWCGDVGWELWEMVHLIERGGNYGWSAMEASQPVRADAPKAPTPIRPPVIAHSHDEAASITGGYVYHGKKLPELEGAYVYGDWETGKIWALWHDGHKVTRHEEIADTPHKIIAFGQDADGELIYAHYGPQGTLHTLEKNPDAGKANAFPRKLSETGLFSSIRRNEVKPAPGTHAFAVNVPMWDSGALAWHLLALPGTSAIQTKIEVRRTKDGQPAKTAKLTWPEDAVLAKTLVMWLKRGEGATPIETQVLHHDGGTWQAYTYRWNDAADEADLVPASGDERTLTDAEGRRMQWRFLARSECLRCHNAWVGGALAFRPEQLSGKPSQFDATRDMKHDFVALGLADAAFMEADALALAPWSAVQEPAHAARSYLHANCAPCHRENAGGAVTMMLNAELPAGDMRAVGMIPLQGGLGLQNPKLIDPGNPWNSVIPLRLAKSGAGHMPVIGPREVDVEGLKLIEDWIARMGDGVTSAADLLPKEWSEPLLHEKLATVEGAMQVRRAVDDGLLKDALLQTAFDLAWKSPLPTVRDLFERFKPEEMREETLGLNPDVAKLLAIKGDAKRGAAVLSLQGKLAACYACHFIGGTGRDFGPDLSKLGARMKREQILESLLQPGKVIAPGYAAVVIEMKDGAMHTGFFVKEDGDEVALKTATGQTVNLRRSDMETLVKLPASLMPEGQLQGLTPQEAADVVSFLEGLK